MHVRQVLDTEAGALDAEADPMPVRTFLTDVFDQLLVKQPGLHRSKETQPGLGHTGYVCRDVRRGLPCYFPALAVRRAGRREMLKVDRLLQQLRLTGDVRPVPRLFLEELSPRIINEIRPCQQRPVHRAYYVS